MSRPWITVVFFIQNYEFSWGWLFFVVKWMKYQYFHFGVFHLLMICSPFRLFDFLMLRTSRFFIFWDSLSSNFGPSRLPCGSLGSHLPHHWHAFYAFGIYLPYPFEGGGGTKQSNKQTSNQANKQTSKQANKQTHKQISKQASKSSNKISKQGKQANP